MISRTTAEIIDTQRRKYLLGAAALALHACGRGVADAGGAEEHMTLSELGAVPGDTPAALINAFTGALERLSAAGGGTLVVPPGLYDFGSWATNERIIYCENLSNVVLSAYGATFRINTTEATVPSLFYFLNSNNITIAGASFTDSGFDPDVNWRGMYGAKAEATRPCSGFRMIDCAVNGAVGLFQTEQYDDNRFLISDISLHGTIENAYYGAALSYTGNNASVDLACRNVRRGLVSFGLRNASIKIRMDHVANRPGSNGFIALVCEGQSQGNVENVSIDLVATGIGTHTGLIHLNHQQAEGAGHFRNINVAVNVSGARSGTTPTDLCVCDHALPDLSILPSTAREWDQIFFRGSVETGFLGRIIHNPSVSIAPGVIYVHPGLVSQTDVTMLPAHVRVQSF